MNATNTTLLMTATEETENIPSTNAQLELGHVNYSYRLIYESSNRISQSRNRLEKSLVKEKILGNSSFI